MCDREIDREREHERQRERERDRHLSAGIDSDRYPLEAARVLRRARSRVLERAGLLEDVARVMIAAWAFAVALVSLSPVPEPMGWSAAGGCLAVALIGRDTLRRYRHWRFERLASGRRWPRWA